MTPARFTSLVVVALGLAACDEPRTPADPAVPPSSDVAKMRRDFQDGAQRRIDQLGVEIEKLRVKAKNAQADARPRLEKLGDDLEVRRKQLAADLRELGGKIETKWDEFKAKMEIALSDLERAVKDALD